MATTGKIEWNWASMSALFFVIAVYEGYKFFFRPQNQPKGDRIWIKIINFAPVIFRNYHIIYKTTWT